MLGVLGAFIRIANQIVAIGILIVLTMVFFVELIGMVFGSLLLLDQRHVLWQQGVVFPLLLSIAPKILMLMTLAFGIIWPGCHDIGTFDHIVWTRPCRPCNMDIPPRPGEVLVARFGWVISRSVADMDRVHAWLAFVQRRI